MPPLSTFTLLHFRSQLIQQKGVLQHYRCILSHKHVTTCLTARLPFHWAQLWSVIMIHLKLLGGGVEALMNHLGLDKQRTRTGLAS